MNQFPRFSALLEQIPAAWRTEDYVLIGSATLAVAGIRDVNDLDVLVHPLLAAKLGAELEPEGTGSVYARRLLGTQAAVGAKVDVFLSVPRIRLGFDAVYAMAMTYAGRRVQCARHTLAIKALAVPHREQDVIDMLSLAKLIAAQESAERAIPLAVPVREDF